MIPASNTPSHSVQIPGISPAWQDHILRLEDLKKHFPLRQGLLSKIAGYVYAVDGVSFAIRRGETLGLVGESGCGKSTVGRCITRLYRPTSGRITFKGQDISVLPDKQLIDFRTKVQIIFQDPYSSLNPRLRVREIIGEALRVHRMVPQGQWLQRTIELMKEVGLQPDQASRYPHEFSGGQRQRIGIARALAMNPELIVADEPVSALDVSIQAQVINLLDSLKAKHHLSYLVIAHDLAVVEHISDRIAVMYLGKLVELASDSDLYNRPKHPYTRALLSAVPLAAPGGKARRRGRQVLGGDVPSPINPPPGCPFHPRCPKAMGACKEVVPPFIEVEPDHWSACLLYT